MKELQSVFTSNEVYQSGTNQVKQSFKLTKKDIEDLTTSYPNQKGGYLLVVQTPSVIITVVVIKCHNQFYICVKTPVFHQVDVISNLDALVQFVNNLK